MKFSVFISTALILAGAAQAATTATAAATGDVILTVQSGSASDDGRSVTYSMDDLRALKQTSIVTTNEFVEGPTEFTGPLLRDVVASVAETDDSQLILTALNDYQVDMPIADSQDYDVIVALERDGEPMSVRENGPLWIIYPMSDHPELNEAVYSGRLVWQLKQIDVLP